MRVYVRKYEGNSYEDVFVGEAEFPLPEKIPKVGYIKQDDKYIIKAYDMGKEMEITRIVAWIENDKLILNSKEPGYHLLLANIWWELDRKNKKLEDLVWRLK